MKKQRGEPMLSRFDVEYADIEMRGLRGLPHRQRFALAIPDVELNGVVFCLQRSKKREDI
jgi:hypothetical protein